MAETTWSMNQGAVEKCQLWVEIAPGKHRIDKAALAKLRASEKAGAITGRPGLQPSSSELRAIWFRVTKEILRRTIGRQVRRQRI